MESTSFMTTVRQRRDEKSRKEYKSPYVVTLPSSSELLLLESLAQLANAKVRNANLKDRIDAAVETIQRLLKSYPSATKGGFSKSIVRLRTAIQRLPEEDVDPEYYSVMEEGLVERLDCLRTRIVRALAWERRKIEKTQEPGIRTVDAKVIADPKNSILSILISDHKINVEFLYRGSIETTNKMKNACDKLQKVDIPQSMKISIVKTFEKLIQCFSLEASIPFKLKEEIEKLVDQLMRPRSFGKELVDTVKMLRVKAENCLIQCTHEKESRVKQLEEISRSFQGLDTILSETKRPYWMMDLPNTFERRKLSLESELKAYTDAMKKKYKINEPEENTSCQCNGLIGNNLDCMEIPLCPDMLSYTKEIKSKMEVPTSSKPLGHCHCAWLFNPPMYTGKGPHCNDDLRMFTTSVLKRAKAYDVVDDVTSCFCNWMHLQRVFGGVRNDVCPAAEKN